MNLKALSYGFCELVHRPVWPTGSVFVIQHTARRDAKTTVLWARPQNEPCTPDFLVPTSWVVCGSVQMKCDGTRWRKGGEVKGKTGEWSGYSILFTLPRNMVYPALLPLTRTPRLPVVDWTDTPDNLNGLVRFAERRNLVSARVPLLFKCSLPMPHFLRVKYPDVKLATHSRLAPGISVEQ